MCISLVLWFIFISPSTSLLLLNRAALPLSPIVTFSTLMFGIASIWMQDPALHSVRFQDVLTGPPLKPVKGSLYGIPFLQHGEHITQICFSRKLAEDALNPTVHITNRHRRSQYWTQGTSLITDLHVVINYVSVVIQLTPYLLSGLPVKFRSLNDISWTLHKTVL